jgi:hypothetical protein
VPYGCSGTKILSLPHCRERVQPHRVEDFDLRSSLKIRFGVNPAVGDIQHMVFQETDAGPFYLSPVLQNLRCYDEIIGMKVKNRLKTDLCEDCKRLGFAT